MSGKKQYISVAEYFDDQPEQTKIVLIELRKCIIKVVPEAIEILNYNIPAYTLTDGGKRDQQIMIAGFKNHVGFYPHPSTIERFDNELLPYKKGKGSVQFPLDKPQPLDLIERMISYRKSILLK